MSSLQKLIETHHLESIADLILESAADCYTMEIVDEDDYSAKGNTRFGGDPDLPKSFRWPCEGDQFCNFVAQINFAELPRLPGGSPLPREGILSLFVRSMNSAAEPVLLDAHFFSGSPSELRRTPCPNPEQMCDEYLVDLVPQRVRAVPSFSFPFFRKDFLAALEKDREFNWYDLAPDVEQRKQVGQLLGYANAGDIRENLYRQVVLGRLGKRRLMFNDYWRTMEEYEAYIREWQEKGDKRLVEMYEGMRPGVTWLVNNREMISKLVAEWRLLFRLNSNRPMNLNINDADPLYVFIRDEDLASLRFDNLAGEVTQG
jgi:uncharacterized protein YwqG